MFTVLFYVNVLRYEYVENSPMKNISELQYKNILVPLMVQVVLLFWASC